MSKHSPGPWSYEHSGSVGAIITDADGKDVISSYCDAVCIDSDNARLIAAAPELLESLKEMRDLQFMATPEEAAEAGKKASALIARIEGSTPSSQTEGSGE